MDNLSADRHPADRHPSPFIPSAFSTLRPTPATSGRSTPSNGVPSHLSLRAEVRTNDTFSNLVSFKSTGTKQSPSLQEQQKKLAEQKLRQRLDVGQGTNEKLWGGDEQFWNNLGSGRSTPLPQSTEQNGKAEGMGDNLRPLEQDHDDILSIFNSPHISSLSRSQESSFLPTSKDKHSKNSGFQIQSAEDDDDPFGLNELSSKPQTSRQKRSDQKDEEDVLGLLDDPADGRLPSLPAITVSSSRNTDTRPQDKALAELVDMGFPVERAKEALESTESGIDVQAAVGWLLNQAHMEAKMKTTSRFTDSQRTRSDSRPESDILPQWRRNERVSTAEKEPVQVAAEIGTTFLKTAGSLWKQSTKKVQQAYQDLNSDSDSSQPKWMRETEQPRKNEQRSQGRIEEAGVARRRRRSSVRNTVASVTDEALMLETDRPAPQRPARPQPRSNIDSSADTSRDHSPVVSSRLRENLPPQATLLHQQRPQRAPAPSPKLSVSRQTVEEQAAQAYVSSARRRRPVANPLASASEPDLLDVSSLRNASLRPATALVSRPVKPVSPVSIHPAAPPRNIPPITAIALRASHIHRETGNAHFKRGDYPAAHQSYTTSLSHLPPLHPIAIVLLTDRALTALKIGEAKTATADADKIISLIGASKGESEMVDMQNGEVARPMRDYYGKALMRKAEALEQREKWREAADVWREAVEGGHGGATSIQGRARSERAANNAASGSKPVPSKKPTAPLPRRPVVNDLSDPIIAANTTTAAAVKRLRAANAAADKADDEKFALADLVDGRIAAWKGGRADNLRALLGSLDTVLWPEAQWKKISMADLVLPGKVKVQYMKGIAKVHPDKIPTTATTEQRMIAGSVFSTLNEAWDKFRTENGM